MRAGDAAPVARLTQVAGTSKHHRREHLGTSLIRSECPRVPGGTNGERAASSGAAAGAASGEDDVAARLGVDPKTVRRWLVRARPYAHNRAAIADLTGADEADLWPDTGGPLADTGPTPTSWGRCTRTRWAVHAGGMGAPVRRSAEREIAILAYSARACRLFAEGHRNPADPRREGPGGRRREDRARRP